MSSQSDYISSHSSNDEKEQTFDGLEMHTIRMDVTWLIRNVLSTKSSSTIVNDFNRKIRIPDTVLFKNGTPYEWIKIDDEGLVSRSNIINEFDFTNCWDEIVAVFININKGWNAYENSCSSNDIICTAWFVDGTTELLNQALFRSISVTDSSLWFRRLIALQAFVPSVKMGRGYFSRHGMEIIHNFERDVAFDAIARAVVSKIELNTDTNIGEKNLIDHRLQVESMLLSCVIDFHDKIWITHIDECRYSYFKNNDMNGNRQKNEISKWKSTSNHLGMKKGTSNFDIEKKTQSITNLQTLRIQVEEEVNRQIKMHVKTLYREKSVGSLSVQSNYDFASFSFFDYKRINRCTISFEKALDPININLLKKEIETLAIYCEEIVEEARVYVIRRKICFQNIDKVRREWNDIDFSNIKPSLGEEELKSMFSSFVEKFFRCPPQPGGSYDDYSKSLADVAIIDEEIDKIKVYVATVVDSLDSLVRKIRTKMFSSIFDESYSDSSFNKKSKLEKLHQDVADMINSLSWDNIETVGSKFSNMKRMKLDPPHVIRDKNRKLLTFEEKNWLSLDYCIDPQNYKSNPSFAGSVYGFDFEDVDRILRLPSSIQHAIGFLSNQNEMKAHELLNVHRHGETSAYPSFFNTASSLVSRSEIVSLSISDVGPELATFKKLFSLPQFQTTTSALRRSEIYSSLRGLIMNNNKTDRHIDLNTYIASAQESTLFEIPSTSFQNGELFIHRFHLKNTRRNKRLGSIKVVIVFKGTYMDEAYIPARISASLNYCDSWNVDENCKSLAEGLASVGEAPYNIQNINSKDRLGRIVINFEPEDNIESGYIELVIKAFTSGQYNVLCTSTICCIAEEIFHDDIIRFIALKRDLAHHYATLKTLKLDERIVKRKAELITALVEETDLKEKNDEFEFNLDVESKNHLMKIYEMEAFHDSQLKSSRMHCIDECLDNSNQISYNIKIKEKAITVLETEIFSIEHHLPFLIKHIFKDDDVKSIIDTMNGGNWRYETIHITKEVLSEATNNQHRCRTLYTELDNVMNTRSEMVSSSVLHGTSQIFPRKALIKYIKKEIDYVISNLISSGESDLFSSLKWKKNDAVDGTESSCGTFDSDSYGEDVESHNEEFPDLLFEYDSGIEIDMKRDNCFKGGGCLACKRAKCSWSSMIDKSSLKSRRESLASEFSRVQNLHENKMLRSEVVRGAEYSPIHLIKRDLLTGLLEEMKEIEYILRLDVVDRDLHNSYASPNQFNVRAIHGYDSLVNTDDAVHALEHEREKLIAITVSHEVFNDIMNWMLDGWYFGDLNIKKERVDYNNRKTKEKDHSVSYVEAIHIISEGSRNRNSQILSDSLKHEHSIMIDKTEKSIRIGLFFMTFMYFRMVSMMQSRREELNNQSSDNNVFLSHKNNIAVLLKRKEMVQKSINFQDRREKLQFTEEKVRQGQTRMLFKLRYERNEKTRKLQEVQRKSKKDYSSALVIQRWIRGHFGRILHNQLAQSKSERLSFIKLSHAKAVVISRVWRGYQSRKLAKLLRKEMAIYILKLREDELFADVDEPLKVSILQKWKGSLTRKTRKQK